MTKLASLEHERVNGRGSMLGKRAHKRRQKRCCPGATSPGVLMHSRRGRQPFRRATLVLLFERLDRKNKRIHRDPRRRTAIQLLRIALFEPAELGYKLYRG